jgi:serine/threonine-protein kinase HipA
MHNSLKDAGQRKEKKMNNKIIFVYAHWDEIIEPVLLGSLIVQFVRGKEIFSFEYDRTWLSSGFAQMLDPDLQMFPGRQFSKSDKSLFGMFTDSSPDRWGRLLMQRREVIISRKENREARSLSESDYLLGVHDISRMGALRFKTALDGKFLAADSTMAAPPWTRLGDLECAARELDDKESISDGEQWLDLLLAPGSSLGGARPKSSVVDTNGGLWIAKFPSKQDDYDMGAWEMTVHELARNAGLDLPEARLEKYSKYGSTFLVRRFDRTGDDKRIHFASAMTLLGKTDGASGNDGSSYLEIAEFIMRSGASPKKDLEELWRRIAFSIAVSNTDDHLRNHGFILTGNGWRLSPAYDINPNPHGGGLSLNISEHDNSLDFNLLLSQAKNYQLTAAKAEGILSDVLAAASEWREKAADTGLSRNSIDQMARAFRTK